MLVFHNFKYHLSQKFDRKYNENEKLLLLSSVKSYRHGIAKKQTMGISISKKKFGIFVIYYL